MLRCFLLFLLAFSLGSQAPIPSWFTGPRNRGLWEVGAVAQTATEGARLTVLSQPRGANVYLGGKKIGITPLKIYPIDRGAVEVTLRLASHFPMSLLLNATDRADYTLKGRMERAYARLRVLHWRPDLVVTANGNPIATPEAAISSGRVAVRLRRFGFRDILEIRELEPDAVFEVDPLWVEAPLEPKDFGVPRRTLSPGNPGRLGEFRWNFEVHSPGSGTLQIFGPHPGVTPLSETALPRFTSWNQIAVWTPPPSVPDGTYRAVLLLRDRDGKEFKLQTEFYLDARQRFLPGWGDAPGPSVLPADTLQLAWRGRWQDGVVANWMVNEVRFRAGFPWLEAQAELGIGTNLRTTRSELSFLAVLHSRPVALGGDFLLVSGDIRYALGLGSDGIPVDFPWVVSPGLRTALPLTWFPTEGFSLSLEPAAEWAFFPRMFSFVPRLTAGFFGREHRLAVSASWSSSSPEGFRAEADASFLPGGGSLLLHLTASALLTPRRTILPSFGAGLGIVP